LIDEQVTGMNVTNEFGNITVLVGDAAYEGFLYSLTVDVTYDDYYNTTYAGYTVEL
jgi:hypothetical protein